MTNPEKVVTPAEAGVQCFIFRVPGACPGLRCGARRDNVWIPAFAGMTLAEAEPAAGE
jgi:hypothetical protein